MDDLSCNLRLVETIAASAAMVNARTVLEYNASEDEEWCEGIRRHVFPLLEAEHERLQEEYHRLRR